MMSDVTGAVPPLNAVTVPTKVTSANTISKVLRRVPKTSAASEVLLQLVPVKTISFNGRVESSQRRSNTSLVWLASAFSCLPT